MFIKILTLQAYTYLFIKLFLDIAKINSNFGYNLVT